MPAYGADAQTSSSLVMYCTHASGLTTVHAMQMQKYCNSLGEDVKAEHTAVLVTQLANWAVASRKMQHVIKLPLDGLQEQASLCMLDHTRQLHTQTSCIMQQHGFRASDMLGGVCEVLTLTSLCWLSGGQLCS